MFSISKKNLNLALSGQDISVLHGPLARGLDKWPTNVGRNKLAMCQCFRSDNLFVLQRKSISLALVLHDVACPGCTDLVWSFNEYHS